MIRLRNVYVCLFSNNSITKNNNKKNNSREKKKKYPFWVIINIIAINIKTSFLFVHSTPASKDPHPHYMCALFHFVSFRLLFYTLYFHLQIQRWTCACSYSFVCLYLLATRHKFVSNNFAFAITLCKLDCKTFGVI